MTSPLARLTTALAERYTIERELGQGGMATVYLAKDRKHDRPVALKVLRPELAAVLGSDRFLREVKITARLNHPHILPLLDSGEAEGFVFYAMPYVAGESLRDRLTRETQLPVDDALQIAREVADALSYAHSQEVIHRDIKPENILLSAGHAVVADFGIARAITAAGGEKLTGTGVAIGTPKYMSPEQAAGSKDLDGRSDLYSLGCVLYEMLAGQPPFTGPTVESIVRQHLMAEPPSVTSIRPAVPGWVTAALTRALAKTPADRFSPVALFAEALGSRGSTQTPTAPAASVVPAGRRPWQLVLIGVAAAVVIGGAFLLLRGRPAPAYPRTAIAVLPFENLSAVGPYAYFAGGLQDELITQLSKVAALRPISRTSVMGYAGPNVPPLRQIARELEVGSLVEASVQVVGDRLRVNVQLIDAATNAHLWAEHYDRKLDDAFAIQSEVAQQVVAAVGAVLTAGETRGLAAAPTASAEAYRLYLQGREYWSRPGNLPQNYSIAQQLYERALALDPGFALAHAALSELHGLVFYLYDHSPARAARERAEAEAAQRLAPDLPQTHTAIGMVHYWSRDFSRALAEFQIAKEGLPNDAEVWGQIGNANRRLGNANDAILAHERRTQLAPRNADFFKELGTTYTWMHRYAEAVVAFDRAFILAPDVRDAAVLKGLVYVHWQGQLDSLRAALRTTGTTAISEDETAESALDLMYWDRQADGMLQVSRTMARARAFQFTFLPASLYAAWAHQLRGDHRAAQGAFDAARVLLDSVIRERPDDEPVHAARGFALAGLGRRDEALREARWLQQSRFYREDKYIGSHTVEARARILARAGDADAALDDIERLLAGPSLATVSVTTLRLDPSWDPIRELPRFKALLIKYAVH